MCCRGCVVNADGIHVIQEWVARDTPGVTNGCGSISRGITGSWWCPDASSQNRSTKNAGISDFGLMKQAGLKIQVNVARSYDQATT